MWAAHLKEWIAVKFVPELLEKLKEDEGAPEHMVANEGGERQAFRLFMRAHTHRHPTHMRTHTQTNICIAWESGQRLFQGFQIPPLSARFPSLAKRCPLPFPCNNTSAVVFLWRGLMSFWCDKAFFIAGGPAGLPCLLPSWRHWFSLRCKLSILLVLFVW